ncbi:4Fe-4S binding protein [Bacteroidota bacterium]
MNYIKNKNNPIQKYRSVIQIFFVLLCIWIGVEFYLFVDYLENGSNSTFYERPPGAEAFLPISSLMSIWYFLQTGIIHNAHPAGFFILLAVILGSFVFGKSFCSWICPIGTLSEYIADFGEKIQNKLFRKIYKIPRWLDYPLRSLKYLLLGFFAYSIFFAMTTTALDMFLGSAYNIMADIKMWYFFIEISKTSIIVISVLFLLSIFIRNFWCRYLCPYGALLGLFTILSPNKIKRNVSSCIDCSLCTKACPSSIKVEKVKTVISDECTTCMNCVDVCPVANTLELRTVAKKYTFPKKLVAFGVAFLFVLLTGLGMLTGNWQNNIAKEEYLHYFENINSLGHPRTISELEKLDK